MYEREKELYSELGQKLTDMLCEKRDAYGDNLKSTGQFLKLLYPDGIPTLAYNEVTVIVRVLDKLFRIANQHIHDSMGDSWKDQESPWWDIAGYGLAITVDRVCMNEELNARERDRRTYDP